LLTRGTLLSLCFNPGAIKPIVAKTFPLVEAFALPHRGPPLREVRSHNLTGSDGKRNTKQAPHAHGELDAAGAAFEVGYESPSQFDR
jgi:hypothetical protein